MLRLSRRNFSVYEHCSLNCVLRLPYFTNLNFYFVRNINNKRYPSILKKQQYYYALIAIQVNANSWTIVAV